MHFGQIGLAEPDRLELGLRIGLLRRYRCANLGRIDVTDGTVMAFCDPTCDSGIIPKFVKSAGLERGIFLQLLNDLPQRGEVIGGSQSIVPKVMHGHLWLRRSSDGQLRGHMVSRWFWEP